MNRRPKTPTKKDWEEYDKFMGDEEYSVYHVAKQLGYTGHTSAAYRLLVLARMEKLGQR